MRQQHATGDMAIAALAARQHGVVSYEQLLSAGLSGGSAARRVRTGRLHRVHRGVYAVGHRGLTYEGLCMAATLAYGTTAVVSHRSAAALWGMLRAAAGPIDVSVPGTGGKERRKGIRLHRSKSLASNTTTRHRGIPLTTPTRTIADLQRAASPDDVRRAARQASVLGLRIDDGPSADRTRSDLELAFLRLCERHALPGPEVNVMVDSLEVDFLWRDQQLIVETDGYRYHRGRAAFEHDRGRDLKLRAAGFEVLRFSYRQVCDEAEQIAMVLQQRLVSRS